MFSYELLAGAAIRLLQDLPVDVRAAVTDGAKPLGDDLVRAIRARRGPSPYGRVYAQLARNAKVRTRKGRAPEVVVGSSRRLSGGGTVNQLIWPYEYGSATGDLKRGPARVHGEFHAKLSHHKRNVRRIAVEKPARNRGRFRYYSVTPQFPPWQKQGHWINSIVDDHREDVLAGWVALVDDALAGVARKDHG